MTAEECKKLIDDFFSEALRPPKPPMSDEELIELIKPLKNRVSEV